MVAGTQVQVGRVSVMVGVRHTVEAALTGVPKVVFRFSIRVNGGATC